MGNYGFEISVDDIENVLNSHKVDFTPKDLVSYSELIDYDVVSDAAMNVDFSKEEDWSDVLDKQTEAAYDEIALQLLRAGVISDEQVKVYGNKDLLNVV